MHAKAKTLVLGAGALLVGLVATTVDATTASAASDRGELEGIVGNRTGQCPNLSFTVLGTKVTTSASTKFEDGVCDDIANGRKIEVKVPLQATNGAFEALKVELKKH